MSARAAGAVAVEAGAEREAWRCPSCGQVPPPERAGAHRRGADPTAMDCPRMDLEQLAADRRRESERGSLLETAW